MVGDVAAYRYVVERFVAVPCRVDGSNAVSSYTGIWLPDDDPLGLKHVGANNVT